MFRRIRKKITIYLVKLLFLAGPLIPYRMAQKLGAMLGALAYHVLGKYRKVALHNLKERLQVEDPKARSLAKRVFQNQGMNFMEFFYLQNIKKSHLVKYFKVINLENMWNAYAKKNGVILLTAHFGNWEALARFLCQSGFTLNVIARKFYIQELDDILAKQRSSIGMKVILRGETYTARHILKALKAGEIIGMLVDQNVKSVPSTDVDFFGTNAPAPVGMAAIALRNGCSIVPCFSWRNAKGVHVVECLPEMELEKTGDHQKDVVLNTQKITGIIESFVRKHPDQWVWFHKRWPDHLPA